MKLARRFILPLLAVAVLGACAMPPSGNPGSLLGQFDSVLRGATGTGSVQVRTVPPEIKTGQAIELEVDGTGTGYVYLYQLETDGKALSLLFPNAIDGANYVNGPLRLPRPNWRVVARGPAGVGYFLAVRTEQQQDLLALAEQARQGVVKPVGPYVASMTQLKEIP